MTTRRCCQLSPPRSASNTPSDPASHPCRWSNQHHSSNCSLLNPPRPGSTPGSTEPNSDAWSAYTCSIFARAVGPVKSTDLSPAQRRATATVAAVASFDHPAGHRIDPWDPRLEDYRELRDPARRREREARSGRFIAEGVTVVRRLLGSRLHVHSVLVLEGREDRVLDVLPERVPMLVVDRETMRSGAGFDVHRG